MRVSPSNLLSDGFGDCFGVITSGAEVGSTAHRDKTMDTQAESEGKTVDEEMDEVGIGVVSEEVSKDRYSDRSEDSRWHVRTEIECGRWMNDAGRRRRCRCERRRICCGSIDRSRGTGDTRMIRR